ncbi:hypothetical protein FRC18_010467 [Serendipita sp. 400]|nr:hypothetical protein FRC18_010467 [Serendipita sp. 400]
MPSKMLLYYQFLLVVSLVSLASVELLQFIKGVSISLAFTLLYDRVGRDGDDLSRKTMFMDKFHACYHWFCLIWILIVTFRRRISGFRYMRWMLLAHIIISSAKIYVFFLADKESREVQDILCLRMEKAGMASDKVAECHQMATKLAKLNFSIMKGTVFSACQMAFFSYFVSKELARRGPVQQNPSNVEKKTRN